MRACLPNYDPGKADLFQDAVGLAVDKIVEEMFKNKQEFLLDGTFAGRKSYTNVERSLKRGRKVGILFLYQEPKRAWEFTQVRAAMQKRTTPQDAFISAFLRSQENVDKVKAEFGNKVQLWLIIKNYEQGDKKIHFNIDKLEHYLKKQYNPQTLREVLT